MVVVGGEAAVVVVAVLVPLGSAVVLLAFVAVPLAAVPLAVVPLAVVPLAVVPVPPVPVPVVTPAALFAELLLVFPDGPVAPALDDISCLFIETIIHQKTHVVGKREEVASITLNMAVIKPMPRLSRGHVPSPGEPMPASETNNRQQGVANLVDNQDRSVCDGCVDAGLMEHHHLGELCQQQLLGTPLLGTLFAGPICDGRWANRFPNRIGYVHLLGRRRDRELGQRIWANIGILAVITFDSIRNLEANQFVKEWNLVREELDQLMGIANSLSGGHVSGPNTLVEGFQSFISTASPDFGKTHLDGIV